MDRIDDNDDLILDLLAKDDTLASTLLYVRYHRVVFNYVNSIVANRESSKDIVQDLFIAIWEKRHSLNFTKPLGRYLFAAAHNKALNHLRDIECSNALLGEIMNWSGHLSNVSAADADLEMTELMVILQNSVIQGRGRDFNGENSTEFQDSKIWKSRKIR